MVVLSIDQKQEWNDIVKSFGDWDVYYSYEYAASLQMHGDGTPYLIYYDNYGFRLCYVMMKNDISILPSFNNLIKSNQYYDFTTPYGYGGPLTKGVCTPSILDDFFMQLNQYCNEEQIITQFFRFHPLLQNQVIFQDFTKIVSNKQTIYMDLSTKEMIFQNMDTKNRNMIRKAQKSGVTITSTTSGDMSQFIDIYNETMERNHAESYYYFDKSYFDYLFKKMEDNIILFCAYYENKIISSSIFLYNETYMHYHLSGTLTEYRSLASTNLLLYEAALWGAQRGIKKLHLGGGIDSEDSLFGFKKQFNKNGRIDFAIGRNIFNQEAYQFLINLRKQNDLNFNIDKPYLILYRA